MSVNRQPENTNKNHEAHPSLGKAIETLEEQLFHAGDDWIKAREAHKPIAQYYEGKYEALHHALQILKQVK